jgi:hypothetical protein
MKQKVTVVTSFMVQVLVKVSQFFVCIIFNVITDFHTKFFSLSLSLFLSAELDISERMS